MFYLLLLIMALPAYALGGVNGAIIASMCIYRKDIRKYGSGNPGLTNFYRVFGKSGAALVVAIDAVKTLAPVLFGGWLLYKFFGGEATLFGRQFSGLFVMLGHCFPAIYNFSGGRGVMAAGTILWIIDWRVALLSWGVFAAVVLTTRFVSLGAMIGVLAYPISVLLLGLGGVREFIVALLSALLLIARHGDNIKRLVRGAEPKFSFSRK
ncbi:MAG: glycerol-3-phosphate acyltransferase [Oscillospiraceae bacterium]|jgi:glycerol-3-phosphate acyltransferase PlsY|nr:glycerol-3-phosphate acyltransferase [Oscillospiraceae bacterium]